MASSPARRPTAKRNKRAVKARTARFSVGHSKPRLWFLIVAISGVLIVILSQVLQLQTTGGEELRAEGASQWQRTRTIAPKRGTIFDRNGQELAISIPTASISIDPTKILDGPATLALLTATLGLDSDAQQRLGAAIDAKEREFIYVERQVPLETGNALMRSASERQLPGIHIAYEDKRSLPGGDTGRSVIGRTDIDGVGISGLELKFGGGEAGIDKGYSDILSGVPGVSTRAVSEKGDTVVGTEEVTTEPVPGEDLVLTIDRTVQFNVEKALIDQVSSVGAKGGQVIVMDTATGDLIAMASATTNSETGQVEVSARNAAAVDAYEPGSVVKAITVAAALNEGTITPETTFVVPYSKQFADDVLSDAAFHEEEEMTVNDILVHSSNIGTILIKEGISDSPEVARRTHWNYMRTFGLGERTALDFPGESNGILKDWDDLWGSERATVSYGQGVSSTSIQLISAINAIANDGTYVAPRLVDGAIGANGEMKNNPASATHEVVRPEVAEQMHSMMRSVVCSGTAKLAQEGIDDFAVAGKTGTGYKAQANGTYFTEDGDRSYYASFVGFFPAENPQVTMLISIDEPPADSIERFGGTAAAPLFATLVPTVAHSMKVTPSPTSAVCPET